MQKLRTKVSCRTFSYRPQSMVPCLWEVTLPHRVISARRFETILSSHLQGSEFFKGISTFESLLPQPTPKLLHLCECLKIRTNAVLGSIAEESSASGERIHFVELVRDVCGSPTAQKGPKLSHTKGTWSRLASPSIKNDTTHHTLSHPFPHLGSGTPIVTRPTRNIHNVVQSTV
jgi:hypothetical protein